MTDHERECRHWVSEALRLSGMDRDWTVRLDFSRRGDDEAYACAVSQPQYWRATLFFDFDNPKFEMWEGEPDGLRRLVLHELGHVFFSPYTKPARRFAKKAGGKVVVEVLEDIEDTHIASWERMPCWEQMKPYESSTP